MWLGKTKSLGVAGMGLFFVSGCTQLGGNPRLLSPDEHLRMNTGYGVHEVQKPVLPDTPDLSYFDDRDMAADALGRIGSDSITELQKALKSTDARVRQYACRALAQAGPVAAPAVADLAALLDDPDADVRRLAARALGQIGPAAKDAIPALMRVLGDQRSVPNLQPTPNADSKPALNSDNSQLVRRSLGRFA